MAPEYLPLNVDELLRRGMAAERRDDHAGAIRLFRDAIAALGRDDHVLTRLNLAISQLHDGQFADAADGLRWCEERTRDQAWEEVRYVVLYNLARAEGELAARGDPRRIKVALEAAREVARDAAQKVAATENTRRRKAPVASAVEGPAVALLAALMERFVDLGTRGRTSGDLDRAALVRGLADNEWLAEVSAADLANFAETQHGTDPRTLVDLWGYHAQSDPARAHELLSAVDVPPWAQESDLVPPEREPPKPPEQPARAPAMATAPDIPEEEELRLALVLDAQPELVVWSNACAVELDRAWLAGRDHHGAGRASIYGALCRSFARRISIDVVSATGGGAPSGALLAAALWAGRPLESQRAQAAWIERERGDTESRPASVDHLAASLQVVRSESAAVDPVLAFVFKSGESVPDDHPRLARGKTIVFRGGDDRHDSHAVAQAAVAAIRSVPAGDIAVRAADGLAATRPAFGQARRAFVRVGAAASAASSIKPDPPVPFDLLTMPKSSLRDTAQALFGSYNRWRRRSSIQAALGSGQEAEVVERRLADVRLPWIPARPVAPTGEGWGWGVAPARRMVQLLADLLDRALKAARPEDQALLLRALDLTRAQIVQFDEIAHEFDVLITGSLVAIAGGEPVETQRQALEKALGPLDRLIRSHVRQASDAAHAVRGFLDPLVAGSLLQAEAPLGDKEFSNVLDRLCAVEVVWRSGPASFEQQRPPRLVGITPDAPTPVLDGEGRGPAAAEEKLIGADAGDDSTMRANDFLWGRMAAAVGIVDLLVDAARAQRMARALEPPWRALARELTRADREWLTAERLPPVGEGPDLETALRNDLYGSGTLTRVLCVRAAQLEILEDELPRLLAAAHSRVPPLLTDLDEDAQIEELVSRLRSGPSLRRRLAAADESAS